ncbi:hypothetical protein CEXT_126341 [Caerostris extrusa]|uniref:Uncharacterized protein n=1 Tax=Caerostris extrusa TaxID=172846 RepID=A0AAV4XGC0_CAEEX|nr:hypothetical protein CEXT_126341 [Caerostris extrusa]
MATAVWASTSDEMSFLHCPTPSSLSLGDMALPQGCPMYIHGTRESDPGWIRSQRRKEPSLSLSKSFCLFILNWCFLWLEMWWV